ncbi:MAG: aerotolerance regulator BatA [Candidatus Marinimicrobia bacterium]|nr:aerotolerance regulator BatA [Candidatus Neomarinimicrobiota bacterium]|tara:strand:- start:73 stop:1065 length:993 start_codon:yes stop_codon:yes gene_type:complete
MLEFQYPLILLLLFLVPILFGFDRKRRHLSEGTMRFSNIELIPTAAIKSGENKSLLLLINKLIIITLIIIALSGPRISEKIIESNMEVVDIILVVDQSSSMLAMDFKPNRLGAVKEVAKSFIAEREGDRLGIIVFAGQSFIQCPLTTDTEVLIEFADQIEISAKEHDGTAIGMAIANAINRLRESETESKIMILLSDGSNNQGELDPLTGAELASKLGIKIYTIGAGTKGTAPYPVGLHGGQQIIQHVEVDVDEETLGQIAEITGGKFFRATDNISLKKVYNEINEMERTEIEVKEFNNYNDLYDYAIIPATLFALGFLFLSRGVFRRIG